MADEPNGTTTQRHDDGLVARLATQRTKFKDAVERITTERDSLKAEADRLRVENADLKTRADTSVSVKRVAELEGKLRDLDHRKVFDKLATAKGARPEALEDLWQLSGYKAEKDDIDEATIATLIDEQRGKRSYLFGVDAPPPPPPTPPPKPGAGSGQGGSSTVTLVFSEEQLSDPKFVMQNFERIALSAQERINTGQI